MHANKTAIGTHGLLSALVKGSSIFAAGAVIVPTLNAFLFGEGTLPSDFFLQFMFPAYWVLSNFAVPAWVYRAYKNAGTLGYPMSSTPVFTVIVFFVPVLSYFVPYLRIQELYVASKSMEPESVSSTTDDEYRVRNVPKSNAVRVWWLSSIFAPAFMALGITVHPFFVVPFLISTVAFIVFVNEVDNLQKRAATRTQGAPGFASLLGHVVTPPK